MAGLTGWHLLVLVLVVLLLFGAAKLPALAKSMGQSARVFKGEMKAMKAEGDTSDDDAAASASTTTTSAAATAPPATTGSESGVTPGADASKTTP